MSKSFTSDYRGKINFLERGKTSGPNGGLIRSKQRETCSSDTLYDQRRKNATFFLISMSRGLKMAAKRTYVRWVVDRSKINRRDVEHVEHWRQNCGTIIISSSI